MAESEKTGLQDETIYPKERKETVEYRPGEPGQDCISCAHFEEPEGCSKVVGLIYRSGTCNLWEANLDTVDPAESNNELEGLDAEGLDAFLFGGEA